MKMRRDLCSSLAHASPTEGGLEKLEGRAMLQGSPLPTLAEMTNPNDTIVRIDTSAGDIDIELFDSGANAAPITTANFLGYVKRGDYATAQGITENAVYIAKCRIVRRLRQQLQGMLD